jgi:hypothetical protein
MRLPFWRRRVRTWMPPTSNNSVAGSGTTVNIPEPAKSSAKAFSPNELMLSAMLSILTW